MRNEFGIVTTMTALLAVVLIAVAGLVSTYGYGILVRSELQVAADAAALAGAAELCPWEECWNAAPDSAAAALREHVAHGNVGDNIELDISKMSERRDEEGKLIPVWDGDNLVVRIERGQWTKNFGFRSFEASWEEEHPGVPKTIAMNAIRVTLERPQYTGILNVFGTFSSAVSAESIALASANENVRVAPMAIPVCALLNDEGKFDKARLCSADRLFTRSDRFCTDGGNCGIVPSFPWTPCSSESGNNFQMLVAAQGFCSDVWSLQPEAPHPVPSEPGWNPISACTVLRYLLSADHGGDGLASTGFGCYLQADLNKPNHPQEGYAVIRGFQNERFRSIADHYGVFGVPGGYEPTEEAIRTAVDQNFNPGLDAQIGDEFRVLPGGLVEPESQAAFRSQILGLFGDSAHPPMSQTEIGTLNNYISVYKLHENVASPILARDDTAASGTVASAGICNSIRTELVCPRDALNPSRCARNVSNMPAVISMTRKAGIDDESTVWRTLVPVIADTSERATACRVGDAGNQRPTIDPSKFYEIIGFLSTDIFDADIGTDSPAKPENTFPGVWGFQAQDGTPRCNLVRARASCGNNFVASSQPLNARSHPSLAEGPGPFRYDDEYGRSDDSTAPIQTAS